MITVHGKKTTLAELRTIEPTTPEGAGKRWKPIQHGELADAIRAEVDGRGWRVTKELYSTARGGADMAGALMVDGVGGVDLGPGMGLSLGFLNSNARRKALQITIGASVACCTNGMCTGTILLNRLHDHTVDLPEEIRGALDRYTVAAGEIPDVVRGLRERELSPGEASEILMETARRRLVGWATIGRVDKEYRNPTFKEHGRGTSWALLNAFTYAARRNIAPTRQMETYNTFREMLPTAYPVN